MARKPKFIIGDHVRMRADTVVGGITHHKNEAWHVTEIRFDGIQWQYGCKRSVHALPVFFRGPEITPRHPRPVANRKQLPFTRGDAIKYIANDPIRHGLTGRILEVCGTSNGYDYIIFLDGEAEANAACGRDYYGSYGVRARDITSL